MQMLRLIGVGAPGVSQKRIAVTAAAATRGHRLTLLHGVEAAASHGGRDVGPAVLTRARRRRCHRAQTEREQRCGRRGGHFQKLFHLALSVLGYSPEHRDGMP